jgi:hypothetical protein
MSAPDSAMIRHVDKLVKLTAHGAFDCLNSPLYPRHHGLPFPYARDSRSDSTALLTDISSFSRNGNG